jgi:hypothetical protein
LVRGLSRGTERCHFTRLETRIQTNHSVKHFIIKIKCNLHPVPLFSVITLYLRKRGDSSSLPGLARTGAVKLPATERMFYVYRRITIRLVVSQSFSTGAFSVQLRLFCSGRASTILSHLYFSTFADHHYGLREENRSHAIILKGVTTLFHFVRVWFARVAVSHCILSNCSIGARWT